mmetsp:Transcript_46298/g.107713  ORF Transcript_46298/g.107713 Transcript_46298/m.107713 type:complete len:1093 (+) Transcript_46298:62-3340(+)
MAAPGPTREYGWGSLHLADDVCTSMQTVNEETAPESPTVGDLMLKVQDLAASQQSIRQSVAVIETCTAHTHSLVSRLHDLTRGKNASPRHGSPTSQAVRIEQDALWAEPPRKLSEPPQKLSGRVSAMEQSRPFELHSSRPVDNPRLSSRGPGDEDRRVTVQWNSSTSSHPPSPRGKSNISWGGLSYTMIHNDSWEREFYSRSEFRDLPPQWPSCLQFRTELGGEENLDSSKVSRHFSTLASRRTTQLETQTSGLEEVSSCGKGYDPDSRFTQSFDWAALLVLMYDVVVTPYALAWNVPITASLAILAVTSALFWTSRMVAAFSMGFYLKGELVLDRKHIAKRYLRSTFALDFAIVLADWLVLLMGEDTASVLRFTTLLRMAKVIRLANAMTLLEKLLEAVIPRSKLLMRICQVTCSMLCFTHLMCCFWYAVGVSELSDTGHTWLDTIHDGTEYSYLTAFHWTLAQVTLGATEINPVNSMERVFGIVLLVFGTLFSATIIAFISSETMEYVSTRRENLEMMTQLKSYLRQNHVDDLLKTRIQRQVAERLWHTQVPLSEEDVPAVRVLSTTLRADLKRETRVPHLMTHALFSTWQKIDAVSIRRLCDEAVAFFTLKAQDNMFLPGVDMEHSCYLVNGKLLYQQDPETSFEKTHVSSTVLEGRWVCEAALWTSWMTVGCMDAVHACRIMSVNMTGIVKVLPKHPLIAHLTRHYAQAYHLRVTAARPPFSKWPSDIRVPDTEASDLLSNDLGLELLRQAEKKGILSESAHQELVIELKEEKCSILETSAGRLERIVPVVAVKLTRPSDGRILLEVGLWTKDKGLKTECMLPGKKRLKGELVHMTVKRIMETQLVEYAKGVEVMNQDVEVEARESTSYGLYTKYLKTIQNMGLKEDFKEPTFAPVPAATRASRGSMRSSRAAPPYLLAWSDNDPFADDPAAQEIFAMESDGRIRLYSWMKPKTIDFFLSDVGKSFASNWVGTVDTQSLQSSEDSRRLGGGSSRGLQMVAEGSKEFSAVDELMPLENLGKSTASIAEETSAIAPFPFRRANAPSLLFTAAAGRTGALTRSNESSPVHAPADARNRDDACAGLAYFLEF